MENASHAVAEKTPERECPEKHLVAAVTSIAVCAFGIFFVGVFYDAAWPAAVATCGLSAMGVGVAYLALKRS